MLEKFTVHLHTTPSPGLTYYSGKVTVFAEDEDDAEVRAKRELMRGAFQGYRADMFIVEKVEAHR